MSGSVQADDLLLHIAPNVTQNLPDRPVTVPADFAMLMYQATGVSYRVLWRRVLYLLESNCDICRRDGGTVTVTVERIYLYVPVVSR